MIIFIDNKINRLVDELNRRLGAAQNAYFAVAFIQESGVRKLDGAIQKLVRRGGKLSILFGHAFGITQASAIRRLQKLGVDLRYYKETNRTFHLKGYLFESASITSAIVGSSNLSCGALCDGIEWNVAIELDHLNLRRIFNAFEQLWGSAHSRQITDDVIREIETDERPPDPMRHPSEFLLPPVIPGPKLFPFRINKSFQRYGRITIKKVASFEKYARELCTDNARVYGPDRLECQGTICKGKNRKEKPHGYIYYQIRLKPLRNNPILALPLGSSVDVEITRNLKDIKVRLLLAID